MYPSSENTIENREIRLKQEYFLCSASLQDIFRRHKSSKSAQRPNGRIDYTYFAEKNIIQLNNSFSAWIIPEFMRILVDIEQLSWETTWKITTKSCAFTSHNILSDVLEKWPISLIEKVLPRHMEILYQINFFHLERVKDAFASNLDKAYGLSCISKDDFNMTTLSVLGSCVINGVSKFHTNHLKKKTFRELCELEPEKFINITNGVTPRRWLYLCNPILSSIITEKLGDKWPVQIDKLELLKKLCGDNSFSRSISTAKYDNKVKLSESIHSRYNIDIDPNSLFDVQVHRIDEYKRQLLNCLHVVTLFNKIKTDYKPQKRKPRTVFIGGKAQPGDQQAKEIIKLISAIARTVYFLTIIISII